MTSAWVLDASVAVAAATGHPLREHAQRLLRRAVVEERSLFVPRLFAAEVASALRRASLTQEAAEKALDLLLKLPWIYAKDEELALAALRWSSKLGQARAYDAFYVALAEKKRALLWTADARLVQGLRALGFLGVKGLEEA